MSLSMSNRRAALSSKSPAPAPLPRSHSKSHQLAKVIADTQTSPAPSQYRPDSLWSEGGADVVWNGSGHGNNQGRGQVYMSADSLPSPSLPSPAGRSTETYVSSNTDSFQPEFADADEGNGSEGGSWEADTTMTTTSTPDSRRPVLDASSPPAHRQPAQTDGKPSPPTRPKRMAPMGMHQASTTGAQSMVGAGEEDGAGGAGVSTYGHARNSSVGSSIWAGRGGRGGGGGGEEERPPLPPLHALQSQPQHRRLATQENGHRDARSVASSVYSESWDESPRMDSMPDRFVPAVERKEEGKGDDEDDGFEMMDTAAQAPTDRPRRLADGTMVPKMPPMPSSGQTFQPPATRVKKGRQNRSPILSYADGAEEEERLVQEREFREHGGIQGLEATSRMGPKLKKNSPAPWEMGDDDQQDRSSQEVGGMPASRPSYEQLLPPNMKHPSSWARQSMESFRNRNASNGSHNGPVAKSSAGFPSRESVVSPSSSIQDTIPIPPLPPVENAAATRRSRSKSVSSSAAGVLKGLGLASSAAPATKKPGKFGKAFRGMGAGARSSSSTSSVGGAESRKTGISSDDYAHLPPSPVVREAVLGGGSSESRLAKSTSNGTIVSAASGPGPTASPRRTGARAAPPPLAIPTSSRVSSSTDSHAGTSPGTGTAPSSHHTAGTSPGLSPNKADLAEMLMSSNTKYRDQCFVPSPPKSGPRMSSMTYKRNSAFENESDSPSSPIKPTRSHSTTPTGMPSDGVASSSPISQAREMRSAWMQNNGGEDAASASEQGSGMPSLSSAEGSTPYKLISLQAARQQQQDQQQRPTGPGSVSRLNRSPSSKTLDGMGEGEGQSSRSLKNKKSGFLRIFGKDKGEGMEAVPGLPDRPATGEEEEEEDVVTGLMPTRKQQNLNAPALSLRPMSSMFNGFAPGLLEEQKEGNNGNLQPQPSPSLQANGRLAPPSPAITVHSIDGNSSRASSQGLYEDALEVSPSTLAPALSGDYLQAHRRRTTNESRKLGSEAASVSRKSTESMQSDASSSLGLVNGFPAIPVSPNANIEQTNQPSALALETRSKALEVEAKIADLISELVKLRNTAIDNGLVAQPQQQPPDSMAATATSSSSSNGGHHQAGVGLMGMQPANASTSSMPSSPAAPSTATPTTPVLLHTPISQCSQCGCHCAEQKRVQTLNEMAILKGISVLDRGRALKSGAGGNVGKFGGYLNR